MICPFCNVPMKCVDSRVQQDGHKRRIHRCAVCEKRLTTYEVVYKGPRRHWKSPPLKLVEDVRNGECLLEAANEISEMNA